MKTERLISIFKRNPHCFGIANVVAQVMNAKNTLEYREELPTMNLDACTSANHRLAAAIINTITAKYSDPNALARIIATEFPDKTRQIVSGIQPPYRANDEALLLALSRELPRDQVEAYGAIMEELGKIVKSKPAPAADAPIWHDLGLARQ